MYEQVPLPLCPPEMYLFLSNYTLRPLSKDMHISFERSSTSDNNVILSMKIFIIPPQSNLSIEGVSHYLDGSECLHD
uniref:Uncharacterized protein n=1 Tax=Rhizophagus irregularis (strain DAOM 181602 / DAOM 197198 / MUCL 43194) TaxID=747089 RepID=U9U8S3_RHIID